MFMYTCIMFPFYVPLLVEHMSCHGLAVAPMAPGLGTPQRPIPSAAAGVEGPNFRT